jgi:fumarate reductase subunit C
MSHARPRLDAMRPKTLGPTRTADPRPPDGFPTSGNYPAYMLFGSCGAFLLLTSLIAIEFVWAINGGQAKYDAFMARIRDSAGYQAYFALALVGLIWFTVRFFGLFPKTQPFRMGPFKRPPDAVMLAGLLAAFVVLNLAVALTLGGLFG